MRTGEKEPRRDEPRRDESRLATLQLDELRLDELKISISGLRGIVGNPLTPHVIWSFAYAMGQTFGPGTLSVAHDTRATSPPFLHIVTAALLMSQCHVLNLGICSSPAALYATRKEKLNGGIIITASHNPSQWNGLKFIAPGGRYCSALEIEKITKIAKNPPPLSHEYIFAQEIHGYSASHHHRNAIKEHVNYNAIKAKNFKLIADVVNGVGALESPLLCYDLGVKLDVLNQPINQLFAHPPEPSIENLGDLQNALDASTEYDFGFAQDPDADRFFLLPKEKTKHQLLSSEHSFALLIDEMLSRKAGPVVVNASTSMMIDDICAQYNVPLYRTPVGEAHVIAGMEKYHAEIGGEGSGGLLFPSFNYGRDSFFALSLILDGLVRRQISLTQWLNQLSSYMMVKRTLSIEDADTYDKHIKKLESIYSMHEISRIDGIKIILPDGWFHLRQSNTEAIARLFIEGPDLLWVKNMEKEIRIQLNLHNNDTKQL